MKLPMQACPIMRSVSSVGIADTRMSGVTASACDAAHCGWAIGACVVSAVFGPAAVGACLIGTGALDCRDCIADVIRAGAGQERVDWTKWR